MTRKIALLSALMHNVLTNRVGMWCDEQIELGIKSAHKFIQKYLIKFSVRHLHGTRSTAFTQDGFVVLCLVKNGEDYIKTFIEYHLSLGPSRIVILDNGSTDETVSIAQRY